MATFTSFLVYDVFPSCSMDSVGWELKTISGTDPVPLRSPAQLYCTNTLF